MVLNEMLIASKRNDLRHSLILFILLCVCEFLFTLVTSATERYPFNGFVSSPATRHSNTNFIQKQVTWPSTSKPAGNTFSFDYVVDSEEGHDFFRVYVDGVEQDLDLYSANKGISGLNKAGQKQIVVSKFAGTHTIRFAYSKDFAGTKGRDLVILDNIHFSSAQSNGIFEAYQWNDHSTIASLGWSVGGQNGGFIKGTPARERSAGRPKEQAYVDNSKSFMNRMVLFPSCLTCGKYKGAIEFDYFVDSEPTHDRFRVYLDNVEQDLDKVTPGIQGISGENMQGSHKIKVTSSGSHTLQFEYVKNGSISNGRDSARVDRIRFINGDGVVFEHHDFTGRDLGVTPILVTVRGQSNPIQEWTGGSTGLGNNALGWVVHSQTPGVAYVPQQTVGQSYKSMYKSFALPSTGVIDGVVRSSDYVNSTRIKLYDYAVMKEGQGSLSMVADKNGNHLYLGFKGLSRTPQTIGDEEGKLEIYLDGKRAYSLRDRDTANSGACANIRLPGPEDRFIAIAYTIAAGDASPHTPIIQEKKGDCTGNWVDLGASPSWISDSNSDIKVSEPNQPSTSPAKTSGVINTEIKLTFPAESNVIQDEMLGIAINRWNVSFTPGEERWPDGNYGKPIRNNIFTWATIRLSAPTLNSKFDKAEASWFGSAVPGIDPNKLGYIK